MRKPVIVTGCGRSGTHWLAHIMERVLGPGAAAHEPRDYRRVSDVVVDSRLRHHIGLLGGHRIIHLTRDGRDVVRSLDEWYRTRQWTRTASDGTKTESNGRDGLPFEACCNEWRDAIDLMGGHKVLRLEDLSSPKVRDTQPSYTLPHWTEWDEETAETFWRICGEQMERMGYGR